MSGRNTIKIQYYGFDKNTGQAIIKPETLIEDIQSTSGFNAPVL